MLTYLLELIDTIVYSSQPLLGGGLLKLIERGSVPRQAYSQDSEHLPGEILSQGPDLVGSASCAMHQQAANRTALEKV